MITRKYILPLFIITSLVTPTIYAYAQGEFILPSTKFIIEGAEKLPSVPTNDVLNAAKETRLSFSIFGVNINLPFGMDTIAIAVVKHIIERIVDSTVNWINNGFDGNPAYVTNPKQYFTDIADGVAGEFIQGSDLNLLCSPFQTQVRLALLKSYRQQKPFQCTLTEVVGNIDAFYDDFSQGGWDGWFAMTQNNANNPYGAYLDAKVELDSRIADAVGLKREQLDWGRGFLSWSECEVVNPPMWIDDPGGPDTLPSRKLDPRHVPGRAEGECIKQGPIKTPGVVIESQLENVLGTGVRQLELADEFDELVGALLGQLLEKSVFSAKGLFSAPKVSSGGSTPPTTTPPSDESPITSLLPDVEAERTKYGTPMTSAELGQLLNTVAWNNRDAGWGLSRKTSGNKCPSLAGDIACDILHHLPTNTLYDVLSASETSATPTWSIAPHHNDPNRPWVAPVQP